MKVPSPAISLLVPLAYLAFISAPSCVAFTPPSPSEARVLRTAASSFELFSSTSDATGTSTNAAPTQTQQVEFPPEISRVDRLKRAAKFWSAAVPIVASYFGKSGELYMREALLGERLSSAEAQEEFDKLHFKGAEKLASTITSLKGFYVKTAQIIASRQDLFPEQYTTALSGFTDNLDPMPASLAKAVIEKELLNADEAFEDVFSEFDEVPLGSASVAQVHRAVLTEKYGGPREVAIKIQRPSIESKLMGDISNLIALAKPLQEAEALPLDYYTVFVELKSQLADEFDFVAEAVAMDRVYQTISRTPEGLPCEPPVVVPRPVPELVSKRVLVMDYLPGVPLSRAREEMIKKGIDPESPEAKLFGRKLLRALTETFGRCILETGFFHADPHAGNIFVLDDGRVGLIDFGQVKQISGRNRETLGKVMIALAESEGRPEDYDKIGKLALELGVEINPDAKKEAAPAIALWLFDGSATELPGGYDLGELSPNSPVQELSSFPQDLVLVGRSTILIKGLSSRLGIPWSLANEWSPIAKTALGIGRDPASEKESRVRFRDVWKTLKQWGQGRATKAVQRLPSPIRTKVLSAIVKRQEKRRRDNRYI